MTTRTRGIVAALGIAGLIAVFVWGIWGLPAYGGYRGPYGDQAIAVSFYERHATDVVSAVNFDVRAFDTLGEEYILFTSVMGVVLLLRKREERPSEDQTRDTAKGRERATPSQAVRLFCLLLVGPSVVFGLYVVTHGQLSPGGGFQGGVVLATVPLLVYLSGDLHVFRRIAPRELVDVVEALAAGGFVGVGLLGIAYQQPFLTNVLPLGTTGEVSSSGTIACISAITGLEVAGGFVLLLSSFLSETIGKPED